MSSVQRRNEKTKKIDVSKKLFSYFFTNVEIQNKIKVHLGIEEPLEIRYLPSSKIKRWIYRSIEYNETIYGHFYRFLFGSISICSVFLFIFNVTISRNENFIDFEQVQMMIDYRPSLHDWRFILECHLIFLWFIELIIRTVSTPSIRHLIKSFYFWSVIYAFEKSKIITSFQG